MNLKRRSLLKGMALAGAAMGGSGLAMASSLVSDAPAMRPSLALVSRDVAESSFLLGIQANPASAALKVQRTDLDLGFLLGLEQSLRSGRPQRIIGLVDDASATLILDLARSAGARVQWLGQHHASATLSRHELLSASTSNGCVLHLAQQLNACGAGFSLKAHNPHDLQAPLQLGTAARSDAGVEQWAGALGLTLAALGQPGDFQASHISGRSKPLTGNFVSFSIEA